MTDWPRDLTMRPIQAWPSTLTRTRRSSQFASPLRSTLAQLRKELDAIGAKNVVMQIALEESQFRNDGYPRAGTRPEHPGIILSLETKGGALSFPCDTFTTWEDNLRAVVLTMEKLRAIDRYGVTKTGEQYSGWRAIEGARAMPSGFADAHEAYDLIRSLVPSEASPTSRDDTPDAVATRIRQAKRATHPDTGGDRADWDRLLEAERYLSALKLI